MRAASVLCVLALLAPAAALGEPDERPGARVAHALRALAGAAGAPEARLATAPCPPLEEALAALAAYLGAPSPAPLPPLAEDEAAALAGLACALLAASRARDAAYEGADWDAIARAALSGAEEPALALTPAHTAANVAGAALIARAVDDALRSLSPRAAPRAPAAPPQLAVPGAFAFDLVGTDTLYDEDYALVVDVGGDDVYANNAGGSLVAFGDGGFLPIRGDPESFGRSVEPLRGGPRVVVGGDFEDAELVFSASLVLDLAGNDTYGVREAPWHDARCTADPVVRKVIIQGAGAGGPGLLFDLAGDEDFRAKTVAQGSGHVGGVGVLYMGPGRATLEAVRLAQGSGLFFGVGLLMDEGGDDRYLARVPAGGVFNTDGSFCDAEPRYLHGTGFARVTGGATGVAGALVDLAGDDVYEGGSRSGGFAEVASIGILLDARGHDSYRATTRGLAFASGHPGTSGGGLALLLDAEGNDAYALPAGAGLGATPGRIASGEPPAPYDPLTFWVNDLVAGYVDPVLISGGALLYDGAGDDAYATPDGRANGEARATSVGGLFIDR